MVTRTSRSEYQEYLDNFDQGIPYTEYTIEPLEKKQIIPFIKNFQQKVENTVYSKLSLDNESSDMELLSTWTGGVPYYLYLLCECFTKVGSSWRGNRVYEELRRLKLTAKYQKHIQQALNVDKEGFSMTLRAFADSILMDLEYGFRDNRTKRLLVDPAFIKKKKGKVEDFKSEYEAVNSMGLSFLMISAYDLYRKNVQEVTVELKNRSFKGIVFEFNLQSQIACGMPVRLESRAKYCSGGNPVIPLFAVRKVSVLYGSKECDRLRCDPVSVGDCVFLKPKVDNFQYMDFFVVDHRKATIAESTVLCIQATTGDFYGHVYSGRQKKGFGEIGMFMFGGDTLEDEQPKSHLMKLLSLMFETYGKSIRFKFEEMDKDVQSGHSRIEVLVKEEDEEVEGESLVEWKRMKHFHILYVVGKEVSEESAKGVMMRNCCYLDKLGMKSIFPNLQSMLINFVFSWGMCEGIFDICIQHKKQSFLKLFGP